MANTYAVRQNLVNKGINNNDIGWDQNTGYVTIKGQNFIKPEQNTLGTTFTSPENFNTAYKSYQSAQQPVVTGAGSPYGMQPVGTASSPTVANPTVVQAPVTQTSSTEKKVDPQQAFMEQFMAHLTKPKEKNPQEEQINQLISGIQQQMANRQPVDPYSSPQYAAAQQQVQLGAKRGIRANQEATGASGFGRSTRNTEGAQRIQNEADSNLQTQLVPQIMQALEGQRQQELQNQMSLLNPLMQQQQFGATQEQNDYNKMIDAVKYLTDKGYKDAELTGMYDGKQTTQGKTSELVNQGHMQTNQLNQFKLDDYPAQSQAAAQKSQLDYDNGLIDNKTKSFQLEELKDQNSPLNRKAEIEAQLAELELEYAEPEMKARIDQIKKTTAQIGAAPYRNETEKAYDQTKLETAQEQLKQLMLPKNKISEKAYSEFLADKSRITDLAEGLKLVEEYRKDGVDEKTLQDMLKELNKQFED